MADDAVVPNQSVGRSEPPAQPLPNTTPAQSFHKELHGSSELFAGESLRGEPAGFGEGEPDPVSSFHQELDGDSLNYRRDAMKAMTGTGTSSLMKEFPDFTTSPEMYAQKDGPKTPPVPPRSLPEAVKPDQAPKGKEEPKTKEESAEEKAQRKDAHERALDLVKDTKDGKWSDRSIESLKKFFDGISKDLNYDKKDIADTLDHLTGRLNANLAEEKIEKHQVKFQSRAETDGSKSYIMQIIGGENSEARADTWAATRGAKEDPYNVVVGTLPPSKKTKPAQ